MPQSQQSPQENENQDLDFDVLVKYAKLLWLPILAGFCAFLYLNPTILSDLLGYDHPLSTPPEQKLLPTRDVEKRDAIVAAFKHAWHAYERDAMGADEYRPIGHKGTNLSSAGGIGYTIIDAIDTMLIMGPELSEEYNRARNWVANNLTFDREGRFNTFETTIRILGGLLSAYHLSSNDSIYLEKAIDLADRLLPVFNTPSGLPFPLANLAKRKGIADPDLPGVVGTAEVGTLQLEFRYLSHLTDNPDYWVKVENIMKIIGAGLQPSGLASIYMNQQTGEFIPSDIRLGSRGDSYYEYLLKQYIQTNYTEPGLRAMYTQAMNGIHKYLVRQSKARKLIYTTELIPSVNLDDSLNWKRVPKQDHLVCFLGGSLMLGATTTGTYTGKRTTSIPPDGRREFTGQGKRDWRTGEELIKTCLATHETATGLSPEIVHFRTPTDGIPEVASSALGILPSDWYIKGAKQGDEPSYDARYILRPETIESLFIAFRLTHHPFYREQAWQIFQAIEKHCKVETGGYASVLNVDDVPVKLEDKMETFMLSETLKYLYLIFEDVNLIPLDEYVFNTEAHPLPIFTPKSPTGFSVHAP